MAPGVERGGVGWGGVQGAGGADTGTKRSLGGKGPRGKGLAGPGGALWGPGCLRLLPPCRPAASFWADS